ncbi:hypothetical protein ACQP00_37860 [Dactylosporangium sp. CS-047395]|uniref:hypothetical protein n=1 Tax=Dactylosporangium sp. CS-047395 TaxID=3239936 RepID=UPI003D947065
MRTLILAEARRFARHPALWPIPVVVAVTSALDSATAGRNAAYWVGTLFTAIAFFGPIFVLFAANLVAGGARRGHAEATLEATPTPDPARTWAMALGVALPLLAAGILVTAAMGIVDAIYNLHLYGLGELAQFPLVLTGAGLLGVLGARWLPFTGGVLIVFVAATIGALVVFGRFDAGLWWMWWTTAEPPEGSHPSPGTPWLHAVYLLGLCTCACVAAAYRHRRTQLVRVGGPVLVVTLVVGWLQLL